MLSNDDRSNNKDIYDLKFALAPEENYRVIVSKFLVKAVIDKTLPSTLKILIFNSLSPHCQEEIWNRTFIEIAQEGRIENLMYLMSQRRPSLKIQMICANNFQAFREAINNGKVILVKYLLDSLDNDKQRLEMIRVIITNSKHLTLYLRYPNIVNLLLEYETNTIAKDNFLKKELINIINNNSNFLLTRGNPLSLKTKILRWIEICYSHHSDFNNLKSIFLNSDKIKKLIKSDIKFRNVVNNWFSITQIISVKKELTNDLLEYSPQTIPFLKNSSDEIISFYQMMKIISPLSRINISCNAFKTIHSMFGMPELDLSYDINFIKFAIKLIVSIADIKIIMSHSLLLIPTFVKILEINNVKSITPDNQFPTFSWVEHVVNNENTYPHFLDI